MSTARTDGENVVIRPVSDADKEWITSLLTKEWSSPVMITRGRTHRADEVPGFIAEYDGEPAGLITFTIENGECEIISMNSLVESKGIGAALVEAARQSAAEAGCSRLWLITTNDNTPALRFWQKRGFSLAAVYPGAVAESRRLKPEIPLTGEDGIPIRDEIELEIML